MAQSNVVTTTNFTNFLESRWSPRMLYDTTEEMLIGNKFSTGSDLSVDKIGNSLFVRKIAAKTTNTAAGTVALDSESMTWEQDTEVAVNVLPTFYYGAVQITEQVKQRLMAYPAYEKGVRTQITRSIGAAIDDDCGDLGPSLSVTVSDTNLSAALIRNALGQLRTNAQREYRTGKVGGAVLRVHPSQQQHLYGIPEISNAELRGDSDNPNVTGLLVKAWGADVDISGNIADSAGERWNMLFIKQAFCLVYNSEPHMQEPLKDGLVTQLIGFADAGMAELYDAYAVAIRTTA